MFFLHGNHATCGQGEPRLPVDCTYTTEGSCPAGMTVIPNHRGYDYLGEQLASHGYVVVSINANRGITCAQGEDSDTGLILARGRLVLRHMEKWRAWTTKGGAPNQLGPVANSWVGKVDLSETGLMGHSRGGEGMRAAYNLFRDTGSPWPARIPGLEIRGIFEIASVDGQAGRVLDADGTAWNQVLPLCDGDVIDQAGRLPFERMMSKTSESVPTPKSLTMVWGANHNYWNTEWPESESFGCRDHDPIWGEGRVSVEQQKIGISVATAFFLANVGTNRDARFIGHFDSQWSLPKSVTSITRIDRDFVSTFDQVFDLRVDDFDKATGQSSSGVAHEAKGVSIENLAKTPPNRAAVSWSSASKDAYFQINWTPQGSGRSIEGLTTLNFRVGRRYEQPDPTSSTDFSIHLVDPDGRLSTGIPVSRFTELWGPGSDSTELFQTVRIPIAEFGLSPSSKIRGVRLVFDRSNAGKLNFAHVRFSTTTSQNLISARPGAAERTAEAALSSRSSSDWANAAVVTGFARVAKTERVAPQPDRPAVIEVTVEAPRGFPVGSQLPTLVIGGKKFLNGNYRGTGLATLVFSIPSEQFASLPERAPMQVQYGANRPTKVWPLQEFRKSAFAR